MRVYEAEGKLNLFVLTQRVILFFLIWFIYYWTPLIFKNLSFLMIYKKKLISCKNSILAEWWVCESPCCFNNEHIWQTSSWKEHMWLFEIIYSIYVGLKWVTKIIALACIATGKIWRFSYIFHFLSISLMLNKLFYSQ